MDELIARISKVPLAQRVLVLALVVVVILMATYFGFVSPLQDQIANLERRVKQLDIQLDRKRSIANDLSRFRIEVERLKQRLNEALTELPNDAEIPELLQKIAGLVEQSDCELETFEPQGEVVQNYYARIPVKMAITGNYHAIAVFFDKVSKVDRIVNITDITLGEPTIKNKKVVLDAEFLATTFKFVDRKPSEPGSATGFEKE